MVTLNPAYRSRRHGGVAVIFALGESIYLGDPSKTGSRTVIMMRAWLLLTTVIMCSSCSLVGIRSDLEQPYYEVIEVPHKNLEIRRYGSRLAIETTVQDGDNKKARRRAFRPLFNYIKGANELRHNIIMAAPVETALSAGETGTNIAMTTPVAMSTSSHKTVMRFFLPSELSSETAPRPTDPRVSVIIVPEQTLAVRSFTGLASERDLVKQKNLLTADLAATHWEARGSITTYFYDPPWTLPFLRRNEVVVAAARRKK